LPSASPAVEQPRPASANNSLPSAAPATEQLNPAPIFHLIGAPASKPPAPAPPGAHLEVGVQGRPRVSPPPAPSSPPPKPRHPGRALAFASAAAIAIGSGFLIRAVTLTDPGPPPQPPAWAAHAAGPIEHPAAPLGYARPISVTVARVGIHADLLALGLGRDGAVAVPPTREPMKAAWYDRGPGPGQAGPAVITGHVDSRFAPGHRAAFYELGAVRPGDAVDVARADHRVAVFRVDSVALVPKDGFPTRQVYGPTPYAALRLITCGGHYDKRTGYSDNVIVYAHLVGSR
jgi:hypothetical protein